MSAFLGFIHHLMWQKINFIDSISNEILENMQNNETAKEKVDSIGVIEKGDLAELIDHNNIHGWLAERVEISEERLAKTVYLYLEDGNIEELKQYFYQKGKSDDFNGNKVEAYQNMTSKFLDGMPCDGSIKILSQDDDVEFMIANDVHEAIWNKYSDVKTYWLLRDEYVRGMLENTKYSLEKEGSVYKIRG